MYVQIYPVGIKCIEEICHGAVCDLTEFIHETVPESGENFIWAPVGSDFVHLFADHIGIGWRIDWEVVNWVMVQRRQGIPQLQEPKQTQQKNLWDSINSYYVDLSYKKVFAYISWITLIKKIVFTCMMTFPKNNCWCFKRKSNILYPKTSWDCILIFYIIR